MCEFCKIKPGTYEDYCEEDATFMNGNMNMLEGQVLGVGIRCEEDGTYLLETNYWIAQGISVATIRLKLDYCPNCGRELSEHKKIQLGN